MANWKCVPCAKEKRSRLIRLFLHGLSSLFRQLNSFSFANFHAALQASALVDEDEDEDGVSETRPDVKAIIMQVANHFAHDAPVK